MATFLERLTGTLSAAGRAWRGESAGTVELRADAAVRGEFASVGGSQEHFQPILGEGMTPRTIATALAAADRGYMRALCDIASEQRTKISHLASVLSTRETAIAGCNFEVEPARVLGSMAQRRAQDAADYVDMRFRGIPRLGDMRAWLSGGIYYGRSAVELVPKRDRDGVGISSWLGIHARRLSYAGPGNRLRLYDENGNDERPEFAAFPGVDLRDKYPSRFLIHEPLTLGAEYPWRQGLVRPLVIMGMFWTWTTRDWYQFAELFGKPWRIGYYREGTQTGDIEKLKNALAKLGGLSTAVLRDTSRVDVVGPKSAGSRTVHEALRTAQNSEISKVVLGQTSTTELGDVGTYASTSVHKQVQQDKLADDGRALGETEKHLAYWLVRWKWGEEFARKYTPTIDILTAPDADLESECKRATMLIDRGVPMEVDALRERYTTLPKPGAKAIVAHPVKTEGDADRSISDEGDTAAKAEKKTDAVAKAEPDSESQDDDTESDDED